MLSVLSTVASGPGRFVLLTGEPGISKTRLARGVLQRAQAAGHIALAGRWFESARVCATVLDRARWAIEMPAYEREAVVDRGLDACVIDLAA